MQVRAPRAVHAYNGNGAGARAAGQLLGNRAGDKAHLAGEVGSRLPGAVKGMEGSLQRHALKRGVGRFEFFEARGAGVGLEGGKGGFLASCHGDLTRGQQVHEALGGAAHEQVIVGQHDGRAEALAQRRFNFQSAHGQIYHLARQDGVFESENVASQVENRPFFGGLNPVRVAVVQVRKTALQKGPQLP